MVKFFWNTNKPEESWVGSYHLKNSKEWIELILKNINTIEILSLDQLKNDDDLIIVDSKINNKESFYLDLSKKCRKIYLFHLGDEGALEKKDIIYGCCKHAWRTFFWNSIKKYKNCSFIPLGYKSFDKVPKKKISEKKYLWSYLGTIHHASRYDLNYQLRKVEPSFVKKTQAFGSADSLDSKSYYNILNDSIFTPIPIGFIHPETYRLFECLEIGCIPIVENPKKFFDMLFPNNPFIKIELWKEAKIIIEDFRNNTQLLEKKREDCINWWDQTKLKYQKEIEYIINNEQKSI